MQMPVIVGVVVAIIFLIGFSEWFFHLIMGMEEYVLDDTYFRYRIAGISLLCILLMSGTFYGLLLINDCPEENREGLSAKINCDSYLQIKAETDKLLFPSK